MNLEKSWTYLARFEGLDLSAVRNLTQEQVELACGNAETKLPEGLTVPASWPCNDDG